MEYIHLVGAEQVQTAANRIQSAADDIRRAGNQIEEAARILSRALDAHTAVMENYLLSKEKR